MSGLSYKEQNTETVNITFEPGIHPIFPWEYSEFQSNIEYDWYTTHAWNSQVAKRIQGAENLAYDGLCAFEIDTIDVKKLVWAILPTSPLYINMYGRVTSMAGDFCFVDKVENHHLWSKQELEYINDLLMTYINFTYLRGCTELASLAGLFAGSIPVLHVAKKLNEKNDDSQSNDHQTFNRREILRSMIGLTGSLLTLSVIGSTYFQGANTIATYKSAKAISEEDKDFYLKMQSLFNSVDILPDRSMIGRTALIVQKIIDSGLQDVRLIMGASHNQYFTRIIKDSEFRAKCIRDMAIEVSRVVDISDVFTRYTNYGVDIDKEKLKHYLFEYMARMKTYEIVEPDLRGRYISGPYTDFDRLDKAIVGGPIQHSQAVLQIVSNI